MDVLEVIPLSRTAPPVPLSYRSSTSHPPGTLVEVPLRKQTVVGLVVSSIPVQEAKAMLKTASFMLAKSAVKKYGQLPPAVIAAAKNTAQYHGTTLGSVLAALLVPVLADEIPTRLYKGEGFSIRTSEQPLLERQKAYEKNLADGFTLLIVPTLAEAKTFSERFRIYKPLVLTSALTAKKREAALTSVVQGDVPRLVIATPSFAWVPLPRISHIIIERMSAGSYLLPKRPYVDVRVALTELAQAREVPVTYGDYPLPLEFRPHPEKPLRTAPTAKITIHDARPEPDEYKKWQAVPDEVKEEIGKALAGSGNVSVLAVRKGYAPTVVCRDCGTALTDEFGNTLSLVLLNNTRMLRSADGKTLEKIQDEKIHCKNCDSWNLQPLGVGVERVVEELRDSFPGAELLQIDADTLNAKTRKQLGTPSPYGRIIVGTELMLPWISSAAPVALGVIASADSLLALPFWRARERFVRVSLMLAERSEKMIVITRRAEDAALTALETPTESLFWKEEAGLRKMLAYPPYGTLLVIHVEGSAARIEEIREYVTENCAPYVPISLPPRAISKTVLKGTLVLQLPATAWPDHRISEALAQLPPFVRVHIDSESFF